MPFFGGGGWVLKEIWSMSWNNPFFLSLPLLAFCLLANLLTSLLAFFHTCIPAYSGTLVLGYFLTRSLALLLTCLLVLSWLTWLLFKGRVQKLNCQTPVLGLGLGVDFTFPNNNNNNNNKKNEKSPHLIFHRREGTRGLKFGTQT